MKQKIRVSGIITTVGIAITIILMCRFFWIRRNPVESDGVWYYPNLLRTECALILFLVYDFINVILLIKNEKVYINYNDIYNKIRKAADSFWSRAGKYLSSILIILIYVFIILHLYKTKFSWIDFEDYTDNVIPYNSVCSIIGELTDGLTITQTFKTDLNVVRGISLRTATYMRENTSLLRIEILNEHGNLLWDEVFPLDGAADNGYTYFTFAHPIEIYDDKNLICSVSSINNAGENGITLYYCCEDLYPDGEMKINGEATGGDLYLKLRGYDDDTLIRRIFIVISIVFGAVLVSSKIIIEKVKHIEVKYVFCALAIGIVLIFIIPPYGEHDGEAHFNTIYNYTNAILRNNIYEDAHQIEKDEKDIIGESFELPTSGDDFYKIKKMITDSCKSNEKHNVYELGLRLGHFPIVYTGSIAGVLIGRVLGLNILCIIYLARLCNLLLCVTLIYCAIKISPVYKNTIFAVALLPMSLLQMASLSYDGMIISVIILFIALVFYLIDTKPNNVHIAGLAFMVFCIAYFKAGVYLPVIGIVIFIPFLKYFDCKKIIRLIAITALMLCIALIDQYVDSGMNSNDAVSLVSQTYSITYSLKHPVWFIKIFMSTLYNYFGTWFKGLFGTSIYRHDINDASLILSLTSFLALLTINRYDVPLSDLYKDRFLNKFLQFLCLLGVIMIGVGALSWTNIGADAIWGIQGRYFLPILFPFLITIKPQKVQYSDGKGSENFWQYLMCIATVAQAMYVVIAILTTRK